MPVQATCCRECKGVLPVGDYLDRCGAGMTTLCNCQPAQEQAGQMVSDAQVTVALRAACLHDTRESRKDMRKALEAALLSASPVQQEGAAPKGEWRPIATAPKDGRGLLLGHFNSHGKWRTLRGQWCSADAIAETWEEDAPEGWYETSVESDDLPNCWWTEPTHWMPLPTAPGATPARADAPIGEPTDARDAQRMDWLESHLTDANGIYLDGAAIVHPFAFDRETIGCGTLRAAIDAAMGATPIAAPAGQPALTRYSMGFFQGSPAMFQQPDGDYVRWSDVQAAPSVGQPATSSEGLTEVKLRFHPFPQVQPSSGKQLLLITTSKVFWKGDLYGGKQWRTDSDGWSATQGKYMHALNNLSDVIFWAELPDAVALVNRATSSEAAPSQQFHWSGWQSNPAGPRTSVIEAAPAPVVPADVEALAHRKCHRYLHGSANPNDNSRAHYVFDRHTLLDFAAALAAPSADRAHGTYGMGRHIPAAAPVGQPAAQAVEVRKESGQ
jgi:hypothetical protein